MRTIFYILSLFTLLSATCDNRSPTALLYTEACINTQHHEKKIGNIDVYIKYDVENDTFPGWENFEAYDLTFATAENGTACERDLKFGTHWFMGRGYDPIIQEWVKGRIKLEISQDRPIIDTILYVGEE